MADNKSTKYDGMSASKAKRERAKDERERAKRSAMIMRTIWIVIGAAIVAAIVGMIGREWYFQKTKTVASTDYSAMLNEDGTIQTVNVNDYVKTFDVNGVKIAKADVEYTDEELENEIQSVLESNKNLNSDAALTIKDGDEVSINYVGTMDGVEFEGGTADNYDLTIGSGSFIDDFEQQLIGAHPGDKVTVNVTFPDPYEGNPDYAGKEASFAVTVNGIYELPEFNDAFVKEHLSEQAQTAEEYKQYLRDTNYKTKLADAVNQYITDNISADKYPTDYVKHLKALQMTINEEEFAYAAQMYAAYGMNFEFSSIMDYFGAKNERQYEKVLQKSAEEACLKNMAYQDLAAQAGITVTDEQYNAFLTEQEVTDEIEEQYGRPYLIQHYILPDLVTEYIQSHATVE